jgi:hypothetical protein
MEGEAEPDLTNVDYEDVLHLYRGWRKSEGALKDKTKELNALKIRVKQLQESHIKFRGQIQALESVKELTVSLQAQLSVTQQENLVLVDENRELKDLNGSADEMLKEHKKTSTEQVSSPTSLALLAAHYICPQLLCTHLPYPSPVERQLTSFDPPTAAPLLYRLVRFATCRLSLPCCAVATKKWPYRSVSLRP